MAAVTRRYNDKVHSSTHKSPDDFQNADFGPQYALESRRGLKPKALADKTFRVGMAVRIAEDYDVFKKDSEPRWSKAIYSIERKQGFSYFVVDANGKRPTTKAGFEKPWRAWELLPVAEVHNAPKKVDEETTPEPVPEPVFEPRPARERKAKLQFEATPSVQKRPPRLAAPAAPPLAKNQIEAVPKEVLSFRRVRGKPEFFVLYSTPRNPPFNPSWQPLKNFAFAKGVLHPVLQTYLDAHPRIKV